MSYRGRRYGVLASIGCFIIFCYIFMHEDEPYFVFDNIYQNISGFSILTSSFAKMFRWSLNSMDKFTEFCSNFIDRLITIDPLDTQAILEWFWERVEAFIKGDLAGSLRW